MKLIRLFFTKQGEAAYISHLDLQRVMARALRRSGLPVWYSQGFNPHIYISFALPLPLMQESVCEAMDCKTEAEQEDFSAFIPALNEALPRGIEVTGIAPPVHTAAEITAAEYHIAYACEADELASAIAAYNALPQAMVLRKTKRSEQQVDLKEYVPGLALLPGSETTLAVRLPAGGSLNYNPELLCGFLQQHCGLPAGGARILRAGVYTAQGQPFC